MAFLLQGLLPTEAASPFNWSRIILKRYYGLFGGQERQRHSLVLLWNEVE